MARLVERYTILLGKLALLISLMIASFHAHAAVFEDRRKLTTELVRRHAEGQALTVEEKAVLDALPKIGFAACPDGTGVTGTLIRRPDNGRDAVLVSKHAFINNGNPNCDISKIRYHPDLGIYDGYDLNNFSARVQTNDEPPINMSSEDDINNDFLIFSLDHNISNDVLPGGRTRGVVKIITPHKNNPVYFIGQNSNYNKTSFYYESCNAIRDEIGSSVYLFHNCSTSLGSSSSALTILHDGELKLVGLHSGQFRDAERDVDVENQRELPTNIRELNQAVSAEKILEVLLGLIESENAAEP